MSPSPPPPPDLMDELVEEVLLHLPPDEPAWIVRASAACKPWRRILAAPRFRRRYREFHGTPPVLGLFQKDGRSFVPTSSFPRALPDHPHWRALDCRHGRALFATYTGYPAPVSPFDFAVLDPLTGRQRRVLLPFVGTPSFSAGVLCAKQGCDHHGCEEGHFLVAVVTTVQSFTSCWLYSSETRLWSQITYVHHPNVQCRSHSAKPSVLVGDALYFNADGIIKCQLGTLRLSMFEKPIDGNGCLMTLEDGGLGFAAMVDATNLAMWSRETGAIMGWSKLRVIDLKTLLLDAALWIPTLKWPGAYLSGLIPTLMWPRAFLRGFAEGTQVVFVSRDVGFYMVDLKSKQARKLSCDLSHGQTCLPYLNFYIPAMEAGLLPARGNELVFDVFGEDEVAAARVSGSRGRGSSDAIDRPGVDLDL